MRRCLAISGFTEIQFFHMKPAFFYIAILLFAASCTYTAKIKSGDQAYDLKRYEEAVRLYSKDYEKAEDKREKARLAFKMAESYKHLNQDEVMLDWYKKAYYDGYPNAALPYAEALKKNGDYDEAKVIYNDAGRSAGSPWTYQRQMQSCEVSKKWLAEAAKGRWEAALAEGMSSAGMEYGPTPFGKQGTLLYSTDKVPLDKKTGKFAWTGKGYSDIVSSGDGDVTALLKTINSPYNEGSPTFNPDFTEVYFTRCGENGGKGPDFCKIYYARLQDGSWTEPTPLMLGPAEANYASAWISDGGKGLFFSSDQPNGEGGFDLYFSARNQDGSWSEGKNLGNGVNTEGEEKFPTWFRDTLYFASNAHTGMGGLDMFRAVKKEGKWRSPTNLKAPFNSSADDFHFVPKDDVSGWFTSARLPVVKDRDEPAAKASDNIYTYKLLPPPPVVVVPPVVEAPVVYKIILKAKVKEKQLLKPEDPNSGMTGSVPLMGAAVVVSGEDVNLKVNSPLPKDTFSLVLGEEQDYKIVARKDGFFTSTTEITTRGIAQDPKNPIHILEVDLLLSRIVKDVEIVLEDIYYDFDRSEIREDARPSLNRLTAILKDNPSIKIELSSHTDCRGNDTYNMALSQRRAESVVAYLVAQGIDPTRLTAQGYGETMPRETCECRKCSETQHQSNRRTSFKIL